MFERLHATFTSVGGNDIPEGFARPERTHQAVRSGVGVTQHPFGLIKITGDDATTFLGDTVTCRLPVEEGDVTYGFLLDPDGLIEVDMYIANIGTGYLCVTSPGTATSLAEMLAERTFIQDVTVEDVSGGHAVFGVHGPMTETMLTSVMREGDPPSGDRPLSRGGIREVGLTLIDIDAPTGETGVLVICETAGSAEVFDALINLGAAAVPFGYATWLDLTLEAGTPLFETELIGRSPNVCGQLGDTVDLSKGCFVGQEVVARTANLGTIRERIVGLTIEEVTDARVPLVDDGTSVGTLTRSADSPSLGRPIAMGVLDTRLEVGATVEVVDSGANATVVDLPVVETGWTSVRLPRYEDGT